MEGTGRAWYIMTCKIMFMSSIQGLALAHSRAFTNRINYNNFHLYALIVQWQLKEPGGVLDAYRCRLDSKKQ